MKSYNLTTLFISLFLPFIIILIVVKKQRKSTGAKKLPPSPKQLPIIGHLHLLGKYLHRSLQSLSNEYGGLMFLQLGAVPTIVISSAEHAREMFKNYDRVFAGRPVWFTARKLSHNCSSISFAPYGDLWREHRKILILELLSAKRVQSFEAIRDDEVSHMINRILKNSNKPVNVSELALSLSNKIACRVAFGQTSEKSEGKFLEILHEAQDLLGTFSISDSFPKLAWLDKYTGLAARLEKNFREIDTFFDEVINEHLDAKRPKMEADEDVVDVLLRIQKGDSKQSDTSKLEQIKGVLADIFIAGSDTSSAAVVWTMAELIKNPKVMEKAQREVREVVKAKGKVEESDLSKLVYLKLALKESLRLHPPVPVLLPRESLEKCTFQGYEIPEKTRILINAAAIATDPDYWKNPYEFKPERFLDNSIDFRGHDFELLPFGSGRRGCPGMNFALPLAELALANLIYCFDWSLPEGMQPKDVDMEEAPGLTTHKKAPLRLVPCPKNILEQVA